MRLVPRAHQRRHAGRREQLGRLDVAEEGLGLRRDGGHRGRRRSSEAADGRWQGGGAGRRGGGGGRLAAQGAGRGRGGGGGLAARGAGRRRRGGLGGRVGAGECAGTRRRRRRRLRRLFRGQSWRACNDRPGEVRAGGAGAEELRADLHRTRGGEVTDVARRRRLVCVLDSERGQALEGGSPAPVGGRRLGRRVLQRGAACSVGPRCVRVQASRRQLEGRVGCAARVRPHSDR
mmetsp:Transcript_22862/g.53347  ORF Transcript_22862/g.53347 Transcript_22862/m.53347 type:complete len:233 (-) Transcript_22862:1315-2013(-)